MKLEDAIKQPKFSNEFHKAHINVIFTSAWFGKRTNEILKPFNISWQQFNIMRILRGHDPKPATIKLLTKRMIDKMSNASRLVEKLRKKGLVERQLDLSDRRKVSIILTADGKELIEKASQVLDAKIVEDLNGITLEEAIQLNTILDKIRR